MPETSFPVEDQPRPEVEVEPAPEVEIEVSPEIEVIFEEGPAADERRPQILAVRLVVAAIILAGVIATAWLLLDGGGDSLGDVTSPGTTEPTLPIQRVGPGSLRAY